MLSSAWALASLGARWLAASVVHKLSGKGLFADAKEKGCECGKTDIVLVNGGCCYCKEGRRLGLPLYLQSWRAHKAVFSRHKQFWGRLFLVQTPPPAFPPAQSLLLCAHFFSVCCSWGVGGEAGAAPKRARWKWNVCVGLS